MEKKYSDLLEISERLTEDLNQKQESFVILDSQIRTLQTENSKMDALKADLTKAVEIKVGLEQRLCSSQEEVKKLHEEIRKMQETMKSGITVCRKNTCFHGKPLLCEHVFKLGFFRSMMSYEEESSARKRRRPCLWRRRTQPRRRSRR